MNYRHAMSQVWFYAQITAFFASAYHAIYSNSVLNAFLAGVLLCLVLADFSPNRIFDFILKQEKESARYFYILLGCNGGHTNSTVVMRDGKMFSEVEVRRNVAAFHKVDFEAVYVSHWTEFDSEQDYKDFANKPSLPPPKPPHNPHK